MESSGSPQVFIINNIRRLLAENPKGFEISKLRAAYFARFAIYVEPDRYGFKTWGEMLNSSQFASVCEFFNNNTWVKLKTPPNITVLQPVSKPLSGSQTNGIVKNAPPPPPPAPSSNASGSSSAKVRGKAKLVQRPSEVSGGNSLCGKRAASDQTASSTSSKKHKDVFDVKSQASTDSDVSVESHVTLSPHNKVKLSKERSKILWIQKDTVERRLNFNTLILERQVKNAEPELYIDTTFCDRETLEDLMNVKNYIRRVNVDRFQDVRAKHNAFEFEKGAIFQHGAAIKIANIDALMGMQLTNPKGPNGESLVRSNELLYFVDINGGPGGVAEYFLWKKKWQAKGFGITPRGEGHIDWKLEQAEHFPKESFETFYGESGSEGFGDISRPYALSKFVSFVKDGTDQSLAHVVVASGGEKSDGADEDQKEIRSKYIFLSEFLVALQVIRDGGHFVCRIYDMYTPFTVGLIYLMYKTFEQVAVFKPESSLPASSEKYIICKWKKPHHYCIEISNYLSECHKIDWLTRRTLRNKTEDFAEITHLLSVERIKDSYRFWEYIKQTNAVLGNRQHAETTKLASSIRDGNEQRYIDERFGDIQEKCLNLWGIPNRVREKPKYAKASTPYLRGQKLVMPYSHDFIKKTEAEGESELTVANMTSDIVNPKEWTFMAVGRQRGFYMCLGGNQVFRADTTHSTVEWNLVEEPLELMNNTLVYADLVDEFEIEGVKQTMWTSFHIIDAIILGGKDVRNEPSNERCDLITKFAKSMNKISRTDLSSIRPKQTYELQDVNKFFKSVREHNVRSRDGKMITNHLCPVDKSNAKLKFRAEGVLFVKKYKANFVPADFRFCVQNRLHWTWSDKVNLKVPENFVPVPLEQLNEEEMDEDNVIPVHAETLLRHLRDHYS